ncbi:MAG: hypothetical protein NWE91_05855 [Candidatus Bathyarchaeota archaeon]|nr:hypothetical protein [Candidatus Bathyarchaeota archaeon]
MVLFELVDGQKGENDTLVLVTAYGEPLSFHELLFILEHYFDSEHSYYPVSNGYLGKGMLLSAINCVAVGVPLDTVLKKFKLYRKTKKLIVIDKRKKASRVLSSNDRLEAILE